MKGDIKHFVANFCSCVKQKKPTFKPNKIEIAHSKTTPYHSEGDGQVETMNRTVLIAKITQVKLKRLSKSIGTCIQLYKARSNRVCRCSRLPIDLMFNLPVKQTPTTYPAYVTNWMKGMKEAYALASKSAQKAALKEDNNMGRSTTLVPGDRVRVRNLTPRGGPGNHFGKTKLMWLFREKPG